MKKVRSEQMQVREKVAKSRNTVFFQCFVAPEGRLAKAAGAEPAGQMRSEKLHAVMARSTCPSQNGKRRQQVKMQKHLSVEKWEVRSVKNWVGFGALFDDSTAIRCRKSANRCGAKAISKSKVVNTAGLGSIFQVWVWLYHNYKYKHKYKHNYNTAPLRLQLQLPLLPPQQQLLQELQVKIPYQ